MPCRRSLCMICTDQGSEEDKKQKEEDEIETGIMGGGERQVGTCLKENITYQITCLTCKRKKVSANYIGESSRTCYIRGLKHQKDLHKKKEESVLFKHNRLHHPDLKSGGVYCA